MIVPVQYAVQALFSRENRLSHQLRREHPSGDGVLPATPRVLDQTFTGAGTGVPTGELSRGLACLGRLNDPVRWNSRLGRRVVFTRRRVCQVPCAAALEQIAHLDVIETFGSFVPGAKSHRRVDDRQANDVVDLLANQV